MQSTFAGIELGKRSLFANNQGLQTVGHNLSNASVDGYSRQRVEMRASDPLYRPQLNRAERPGQVGQGVDVSQIARIRDGLLESRIIAQSEAEGYWATRDKYLLMLEQVHNEPGDLSVRALSDHFWNAWQELSVFPEQPAARRQVVQSGQMLVDGVQNRFRSFDMIRSMSDDDIRVTVAQVNDLTGQIAGLNTEIVQSQAAGDNPNDLLDRRDLLVEQLSTLVNVTIDDRDPNEFSVYVDGRHLIQGGVGRGFSLVAGEQGDPAEQLAWADTGRQAFVTGGRLGALFELRDFDIRKEIQNLNSFAVNTMDLVNEVHRAGFGLNGQSGVDFFVQHPGVTNTLGNYDRDGDGDFDSTLLFRVTGAHSLQPQEQIGLSGTMRLAGAGRDIEVPYYATDTVADVVARINNSGAEVVARLDRENRLSLKGTPSDDWDNPDFVMRHIEDSGRFLVGYAGLLSASGPDGAFAWDRPDAALAFRGADVDYSTAPVANPAAWIGLNNEIVREPAAIAASLGVAPRPGEAGDGSAALAIAALRNQPVTVGGYGTFDDYFADSAAAIGLKGQEAQLNVNTSELVMKDLRDLRASISGVSIDEELATMIKFQQGYSAAARFINEITQMLDTILRLGT